MNSGAHSVSEVLGDLPSGRFAALASESGCPRVPCTVGCAENAVNFTEFASHVTSHHSPAVPESVCDALEFDLTRADSVEARSIRPTLLSELSLPEVGPPAPPPAFPPDHIPFDDEDTVSMETSIPGDTEDTVSLPVEVADVDPPRAPQLRAAFEAMDRVNVVEIFRHRAAVMKSVPRFLRGPLRNAMKLALEKVLASDQEVRQKKRGWKVLMMLPRMLLHRYPGRGHISRKKLTSRFEAFSRRGWFNLIEASIACDERAAQSRRRGLRRSGDNIEQRAIRAETFVQVGELSHARQVLEGADLAPGNQTTLDAFRDEIRRPANPHEPMPAELANFVPPRAFELDESKFKGNLRSSRRGAAAGPSGTTMEHLRPLLDDARSLHSFFLVAEQLARSGP